MKAADSHISRIGGMDALTEAQSSTAQSPMVSSLIIRLRHIVHGQGLHPLARRCTQSL